VPKMNALQRLNAELREFEPRFLAHLRTLRRALKEHPRMFNRYARLRQRSIVLLDKGLAAGVPRNPTQRRRIQKMNRRLKASAKLFQRAS
jgi:hypothetical protein